MARTHHRRSEDASGVARSRRGSPSPSRGRRRCERLHFSASQEAEAARKLEDGAPATGGPVGRSAGRRFLETGSAIFRVGPSTRAPREGARAPSGLAAISTNHAPPPTQLAHSSHHTSHDAVPEHPPEHLGCRPAPRRSSSPAPRHAALLSGACPHWRAPYTLWHSLGPLRCARLAWTAPTAPVGLLWCKELVHHAVLAARGQRGRALASSALRSYAYRCLD